MLIFKRTDIFAEWLDALKDEQAKAQITRRIRRARLGNFGDVGPVGEGVSEMRFHTGPGYRVYFSRAEEVVYILLCGGDKKSQKRDIAHAKALWAEIKQRASK